MPRQAEQLVQGCTAATWSSQDQTLAGHLEPGPCPYCHGSSATQRSTLQTGRQSLEGCCLPVVTPCLGRAAPGTGVSSLPPLGLPGCAQSPAQLPFEMQACFTDTRGGFWGA